MPKPAVVLDRLGVVCWLAGFLVLVMALVGDGPWWWTAVAALNATTAVACQRKAKELGRD